MVIENSDYAQLDRPELSRLIFYPRTESAALGGRLSDNAKKNRQDHLIPVAPDVHIGSRFHLSQFKGVTILFFHGNGEIVADYDDLGPIFNELGVNLIAVDYRGYGRSSGVPSAGAMIEDSHAILRYVRHWLRENRYEGPLIVMGRSLGSASALELASAHAGSIDGLIIESGFAYTLPLLRLLGADPSALGMTEAHGFGNRDKITTYAGDTLIIHAELDRLIPYSEAQALYAASPADNKRLLKIKGADHNDILARSMTEYMAAIKKLADQLKAYRNL
jgi:pimeloyl-ACP methyl ester carboxylesterase